jgi:hypothetical protein
MRLELLVIHQELEENKTGCEFASEWLSQISMLGEQTLVLTCCNSRGVA